MIVLVFNCGSSSLKYQVLNMQTENEYSLLAKGLVERIGMVHGDITHKPTGKQKVEISKPIPDHTEGIKCVLELITDSQCGVLSSLNEIEAVGHRCGKTQFRDTQNGDHIGVQAGNTQILLAQGVDKHRPASKMQQIIQHLYRHGYPRIAQGIGRSAHSVPLSVR